MAPVSRLVNLAIYEVGVASGLDVSSLHFTTNPPSLPSTLQSSTAGSGTVLETMKTQLVPEPRLEWAEQVTVPKSAGVRGVRVRTDLEPC